MKLETVLRNCLGMALLVAIAPNSSEARILVHLAPSPASQPCNLRLDPPACNEMVTNGSLAPSGYFAYVLVNWPSSLAGVQFGIDYDGEPESGVDVFGWTLCATLQFAGSTWPESGSGTIVTWDPDNNCQRNGMSVAGYFYVSAYSPDHFMITPRPVDGLAKVANCQAAETILSTTYLGWARFSASGLQNGYNPCNWTPPPSCMAGPNDVFSGSTNSHQVSSSAPGAVFSWTITGNGTILPPGTGNTVQVQAGAVGSYVLSVAVTAPGHSSTCQKEVTVVPGNFGNGDRALLLHLTPPEGNPCSGNNTPTCSAAVTKGLLSPASYYAFVLASFDQGIGGTQFGIQYNPAPEAGVDILYWISCGYLEFPMPGWPASGTGNLVTWDTSYDCQIRQPGGAGTGIMTEVGYFYVSAYTQDVLKIVPRQADGQAKIANCQAQEYQLSPSDLGSASFSTGGNVAGYNPCGSATPVQLTTWSGIKTLISGD